VDPLVAYSTIVQVLQVLGVRFQSHGVIGNGLVEESDTDVTIGTVGVALTCWPAELDLFGEVLYGFLEAFHLAEDQSDVGVGDWVIGIESQ
jgi:hypothetical protein